MTVHTVPLNGGQGRSGRRWRHWLLLAVVLPVLVGCKVELPYSNGFERKPEPVEGETVGDARDWQTRAYWSVSPDTSGWESRTDQQHLDSNPLQLPYPRRLGRPELGATLKLGLVIAEEGNRPLLTFWHKLKLANDDDQLLVQIAEDGSRDWVTVRTFTSAEESEEYAQAEISLEAYRGKTISLRFTQNFPQLSSGLRRWVIDDLRAFEAPLGPVTALTASLDGTAVALEWAAPEGVSAEGLRYHVYRTPVGGTEQRLTAEAIADVHYLDASAANATGYTYTVRAVDPQGEGDPASTQFFVAYNDQAVQGLSVVRDRWDAVVSWSAIDSSDYRYRLYRASDVSDAPNAVLDTTETSYVDVRPDWQLTLYYGVATVRDFTNVFTGETFSLVGPFTGPVKLAPIPPLTLTIDGRATGSGAYDIVWNGEPRIAINGSYQNAVGEVQVIATSAANGDSVNVAADGDSFRLAVAVTGGGEWQIQVQEVEEATRLATATVRVLPDTTAPQIQLVGPAERATTADIIVVEVQASDAESGLAGVTAKSDRIGAQLQMIAGAGGSYTAELPLASGPNQITFTALDRSGNTSAATAQVTRQVPAAPEVSIATPANGALLDAEVVDVTGVIYSSQEGKNLRLTLGGDQQFPQPATTPGVHPFAFSGVRLAEGANQIAVRVESPAGADQDVIVVTRRSATPDQPEPPALDITSPSRSDTTSQEQIYVAGRASSARGVASVTVDGTVVAQGGAQSTTLEFRQPIDLAVSSGNSREIIVVATDVDELSTTKTITIRHDGEAPVLAIATQGLIAAPEVSPVVETPFRLSGTAADSNLSGVTINGQPATLLPTTEPGRYQFDVLLQLAAGQPTDIAIEAWDRAGNRARADYVLQFDPAVTIDILSPREGAELEAQGDEAQIEIIARVSGLGPDHSVSARISGGEAVAMSPADGLVRATLPAATDTPLEAVVQAHDSAGTIVSSARTRFEVVDLNDIELAVVRTAPQSAAAGVEPNLPISVFFNKPIDPTLLDVRVTETVHGFTYDLSANEGAAALAAGGDAPVIEVHRDQAEVGGRLSILPDNRAAAFYLARELAYGATAYVDVRYNGESISRFDYHIRALPSFLTGLVIDQLGQPVPGVRVRLPDLGKEARTDNNGNFGFGFGETAATVLKPGRHRIEFNPELTDVRYSSLEQWANVEAGRFTQLPPLVLPALNPEQPFVRIHGGDAAVRLAQGKVQLDLSEARLVFGNGRDSGDVHAQLLSRREIPYRAQPAANPIWMYAIQPTVRVEKGPVGLSIAMPSLYGSHAYVPEDGTLVLLVGFAPDELRLVPVGVGRVQALRVVSEGRVALQALNYLGFVILADAHQGLLAQFRDGEIGLTELIAALDRQQ